LLASLVTIGLSFASMSLAVGVGVLIATGRVYGGWLLRGALTAYVEVTRGTPVLLQLFVLYYGLSTVVRLPAFVAALLGLGLNYAAYESEIYRGALEAVSIGQLEAARTLGFSEPQVLRLIAECDILRAGTEQNADRKRVFYVEALGYARQLATSHPGDVDAIHLVAKACLGAGDLVQAEEQVALVLESDPQNPQALELSQRWERWHRRRRRDGSAPHAPDRVGDRRSGMAPDRSAARTALFRNRPPWSAVSRTRWCPMADRAR